MSVRKHNGRNKRTRQLGAIERDVLGDLSSGDALYGFLFSARSTRRMFKLARERANDRYRRKLAIERLVRLGYIHARGERLRITGAGQNALGQVVAKTLELLKTKTWDNKWRIAAFDIPEEYAPLRNKVRTILKRAGFVRLQYSIWIFPHECEELVQLIKSESQLSKHILYGVLDRIEDEERLKKLFRLDT
ncbi:MAG: CRISPR-associated endonuclease Cas2 [Patescibacteria group bacterium]